MTRRSLFGTSPRSGGSSSGVGGVGGGSSSSPGVGSGGRFSKFTATATSLWIGGSMFCLVLVYLAVVITVTQLHRMPTTSLLSPAMTTTTTRDSSSSSSSTSTSSATTHAISSLQQQQQPKETSTKNQDQEDKNNNKKNKNRKAKKPNPFKQYDLSATLDHGIEPEILALTTTTRTTKNDAANAAAQIERQVAAVEAAAMQKVDPPRDQHPSPQSILTAYLEPENFHEWDQQPLPRRQNAKAILLKSRSYTRVNSCRQLLQQWPVDDTPAEDDPFLPWIHDVFPTANGKYIQFVAQNRRRCRTGVKKLNETDIMMRMQPQVALFQHVPVTRIHPTTTTTTNKNHSDRTTTTTTTSKTTRYRLSSYQEADPDGIATRFICRFKPSMDETLSVFNFDYDWTSYRKRYRNTFQKYDGGIKSIHTSQLLFQCPVPEHLQETIRTGTSIRNDWATLFVDIIPIRTPPRYGSPVQFLQPRYAEFQSTDPNITFDPHKQWGTDHVLPELVDSGRWENIPICLPSLMQYENQTIDDVPKKPQERQVKHRLVSCIWASAGYNTRGNRFAINDGQRRLLEWISYNKVIGFDHFYLFDNSGAFADSTTSLKPIADLFPNDITYVAWPSQVCNNRPNNVDSPGERSSQYAAEASCRLRFGPHVQWIGQFDIDEYLVPMGSHENVTSLLDELDREDTRIISFGSWRAWPRRAFINEIHAITDRDICWHNEPCFQLTIPNNVTMLQAYNCDRQPPGQKLEVMPAEKQIYRTDYVTHHFIHYSAVTKLSEKNRTEWQEQDHMKWRPRAFPDPRSRFGNEATEALMLHAKAVAIQDTAGYQRMCSIENLKLAVRRQGLCRLGVPWPKNQWPTNFKKPPIAGTKDGYAYNCFVNEQIENILVPRLEQELFQHSKSLL